MIVIVPSFGYSYDLCFLAWEKHFIFGDKQFTFICKYTFRHNTLQYQLCNTHARNLKNSTASADRSRRKLEESRTNTSSPNQITSIPRQISTCIIYIFPILESSSSSSSLPETAQLHIHSTFLAVIIMIRNKTMDVRRTSWDAGGRYAKQTYFLLSAFTEEYSAHVPLLSFANNQQQQHSATPPAAAPGSSVDRVEQGWWGSVHRR